MDTYQPSDMGRLHQGAPEFRQWRDSFLTRFNELLPEQPDNVTGRTVFRTIELDRTKVNKDERRVDAILATGTDVQRRGYTERLDMTAAAVNLERSGSLDGMPLLWDHRPDRHLGWADNVRIHEGVLRARLKFADSDEALEKWRGVEDGTLRSISIGYEILDEDWQQRRDQGPLLIARRWQPLECSVVTIPADVGARIGRSLDSGLLVTPPPEFAHIKRQRELLRKLDSAIWTAENETGLEGVIQRAREAVMTAESEDDFTRAQEALRELDAAADAAQTGTHISTINRTAHEPSATVWRRQNHLSKSTQIMKQEFSLCRMLAAQIDPSSVSRAGYELEVEQEMRNQTGRAPHGMLIPEVAILGRALDKATEGADIIATNLHSELYIETLRARLVTGRLGVTMLNGLRGDVQIPRKTGDATAYWIAGDGADAITESTPTTDNIKMQPKTIGGRVIISRKMLLQAEPAAEMLVRESIISAIIQAIDKQAMIGTGSGNTPVGILNVSGIGSKTYALGGAPAFGDIVDLEGELSAEDADMGQLGYVAHSGIATGLKQKDVGTDTGQMVWTSTGQGEGRMNGYRALVSNNLTAGHVLFGNWADLLIGFWSGLDVRVDENSRGAYGDVIVTVLQDLDVKVRHPESFAELKEAAE